MAQKGYAQRFNESYPIYSTIASGLAERIVDYRGRHNLTQAEFGARAHLTKQTVSEIERGRVNLSRFTVAKINHVLEMED